MDTPRSAIDPWSEAFFAHPYPEYSELRGLGAVVYLEKYGIWATARYDVASAILTDWERFCSAGGAGLANFFKDKPWRPPSLILEADPPVHTGSRRILARIMSAATLRTMRARFEDDAEALLEHLVRQREFDAVRDLAVPYPLKVFPDALGLADNGRENLLRYGNMVFAGFGPVNEYYAAAMSHAPTVIPWINEHCQRSRLAPGGFGEQIYRAVDSGEVTEDEAGILVRSFLSAGVDTTINAIGNVIYCLAVNPDAYRALRADPSRARDAFEETLRLEGPAPFIFRTTTCNVSVHGHEIPKHEKVLILAGAANRDPHRWPEPDTFDIERSWRGHLGFGTGIHGCVGRLVARLEAECVLTALARRAGEIELAAEPVRSPPSGLRGFASVPVRVAAGEAPHVARQ